MLTGYIDIVLGSRLGAEGWRTRPYMRSNNGRSEEQSMPGSMAPLHMASYGAGRHSQHRSHRDRPSALSPPPKLRQVSQKRCRLGDVMVHWPFSVASFEQVCGGWLLSA